MPKQPPSEHVLRAPTPIRSYAIAAGCAVIGAIGLVVGSAYAWPVVVRALAGLLLVIGCALAVAGLLLVRRSAVRFSFDDDGYRITGPSSQISGTWSTTSRVTMSPGGHRITLLGDVDQDVISPAPPDDPRTRAMVADLQRRLDSDRGYSTGTLAV